MKVVCDDNIPYLKGVLEPYVSEVLYLPGQGITNQDLRDADALIVRTRTTCNAELLSRTNVRFIATATIGFDHIDTRYCDAQGITWTNAPGCNSGSVKQYMAAVLAELSRMKETSLKGRTLGIVGVGNVGKKIVDVAHSLGMKVLLNDPPREHAEGGGAFVSLTRLLAESDIVSLHVPLETSGTYKTYHLMNKERLEMLRPDQIIVNASRGEVIYNQALASVLAHKRIAGAVLDVWENEPRVLPALLRLTDIATPHIAGYSRDGKANGTAMSVQALSKEFDFPLQNWHPEVNDPSGIPYDIHLSGVNPDELIKQAILHAYPIAEDSSLFKRSPESFEKHRGAYWNRREFHAYTIQNAPESVKEAFRLLGFQLK